VPIHPGFAIYIKKIKREEEKREPLEE